MTGLWLASVPFLYLAGRVFLPAGGAAAFAVCCLVSPQTLLFTPGKDPAQLLPGAVPLWIWLWAFRDIRRVPALLAGGLFVPACMVSLVHVWLAAVVLTAGALAVRGVPGRSGRFWRSVVLPAAAGAGVTGLALYVCCGVSMPAIVLAVAQAQAEVTRGPGAMPLRAQALGIPLFLLLAGPALWWNLLWVSVRPKTIGSEPPRGLKPAARWVSGRTVSRRGRSDQNGRFGLYLCVGAAAVMVGTVGFTNMETPRLWIPFVPLLLLGTGLQLPFYRDAVHPARLLLAVMVLVQVVFSAAQWSFVDAREAEMRLSSPMPRYFE